AVAITVLTLITGVYTMMGGIKAVIWTDLIQATLMFGSALIGIATILLSIGHGSISEGFRQLAHHVPEMTTTKGYFAVFWQQANKPAGGSGFWGYVRAILESKYTLLAALIPTVMGNMGAFGTDQDMVQRMLTAEDYKKSRRSLLTSAFMDIPIAS